VTVGFMGFGEARSTIDRATSLREGSIA